MSNVGLGSSVRVMGGNAGLSCMRQAYTNTCSQLGAFIKAHLRGKLGPETVNRGVLPAHPEALGGFTP